MKTSEKFEESRSINLDDPTWVDTYTPIIPE